MSRRLAALAATVLTLAVTGTALGITFGHPDGNRHPFVGAMIVKLDDGTLIPFCTGTMVSDRVFLTAAHCTYFAEATFGAGNYDVGATFVSDLDLDANPVGFDADDVIMGVGHAHPSFDGKFGAAKKRVDVAVIVLDRDPRVGQAALPDEGLVETLDLRTQWFTAVGYGVARDDNTAGPHSLFDDGMRRYAEQRALQSNDARLLLSMNPATGNGGTCYGDSGGPHFLGAGEDETATVVSVTSWGDRYCRSTDWTARVDTPATLDFVTSYIDD